MAEVKEKAKTNPRRELFKVIVNNLFAEGQERNYPIPVNDLGDKSNGRAVCYPNKEAILSKVQINILKEATREIKLTVPSDSGVLEAPDVRRAIIEQMPGFTPQYDRNTGQWMATKHEPRFAVQVLGPYVPKPAKVSVAKKSK